MKLGTWLRPDVNRRALAIAWIVSWLCVCVLLWVTWQDLNPIIKWGLVAAELIFCPDAKMVTFAMGKPDGAERDRNT